MKGFTRNKKFIPITDYKKKSTLVNVSKHVEGIRLKRTKGLAPSFQLRDATVKNRVNHNLDILERFYIEKDVSLADRAHAIHVIQKETGLNPRMFGNTDGDVLRGIRHIRSKVNKQRKKRTVLQKNAGDIDWGFDLTDFEPEGFQKVLKNLEMPQEFVRTWHEADPELNLERQGRGFVWEGEGIMIETKNNPITGEYGNPKQREPEKDYAGYIGITGQPEQVKIAVKLIKMFGTSQDESPKRREFI